MSTVDFIGRRGVASAVEYSQSAGVEGCDEADGSKSEFADLLQEAMKELTNSSYANSMYAGGSSSMDMMGMGGNFMPMQAMNNSLEQAILKASETGSSEDAMLALLMLMMMMQSGDGSSSESAMMMQMMAAMIGGVDDQEGIRNSFMLTAFSSGAAPYNLDAIDNQVFGNEIPKAVSYRQGTPPVTGTDKAVLPLECWRPTTPAIVSSEHDRSAERYRAVLDQFDVEKAERYRPGRDGYTYCNIYVWDVTRAMGAELPYYVHPETGAPMEYPDVKGSLYNGAKAMDKWLRTHGKYFGWREVTPEEAQMQANMGKPVVTAAGDVGHVQMVCPSKDGGFDPIRGVTIAQAGRTVTGYAYISEIYGSNTLNNKVSYWVHD